MRIPISTLVRVIALFVSGLMYMPVPLQAEQLEFAVTCDEASEPVGLSYGDHTVGCTINLGDIDRFGFMGTAGDQIRINVLGQSLNFAPLLEVYDPSFVKIAEESCNTSYCSISLDLTLSASGIYTLFVSDVGNNNAGNYILQLERIEPAPVLAPMDYDSSTIDTINPATDVDFYRFNGTPGTDIRLNVLGTSLNFAPVVEIRDPNGTLVVNGAVDGATCNTSYCSFSVDLSPELAGNYSLLIYDFHTNNPGGYQLSLWCLAGDCDSDGDGIPDVDPPLVSYVTPVTDALSPAVDGDFYRFNGTPGTDIRLNVLGTSLNFAPVVEIRDPNGTLVVNGAVDGATCNTSYCSFSVDLWPSLTGAFSLLIYDFYTNNPGGYNISLQCLLGNCVNVMPICGDNCIDVANGPLIPDAGGNSQRNTDGDEYGNYCDPDFDNDLTINAADLAYMKTHFFTGDPDADLNGDGSVNAADLATLKRMFFAPPGPSCPEP